MRWGFGWDWQLILFSFETGNKVNYFTAQNKSLILFYVESESELFFNHIVFYEVYIPKEKIRATLLHPPTHIYIHTFKYAYMKNIYCSYFSYNRIVYMAPQCWKFYDIIYIVECIPFEKIYIIIYKNSNLLYICTFMKESLFIWQRDTDLELLSYILFILLNRFSIYSLQFITIENILTIIE